MSKVIEQFNKIKATLSTAELELQQQQKQLQQLQKKQQELFKQFAKDFGKDISLDSLKAFFAKPYVLRFKGNNEWECIVPKMFDFQVGWLEREDGEYNIFVINKYTRWLEELPEFLREEINFKEPDKMTIDEGMLKFEPELEEKVKEKYGSMLADIQKGKARIKKAREFDLIAAIIDDGCLPFVPKPVDKEDSRNSQLKFEMTGKYDFQQKAYEEFLRYGALGVFWMTGAGKSFFAMKVFDSLKGKKLLVTVSTTLVEQWKEYFTEYAPRLLEEVVIITYNSIERYLNEDFICVGFDECDRLPANTFSKGATIKTKYRFGLSATPYREDGRTNYIFALTGKPIGLDWKVLMKVLGKSYHTVTVHIVKNKAEKFSKIRQLIDLDKKTLIFSDGIEFGKEIAAKFDVEHIYGQSKKRLETLRKNQVAVVSRVMDYGVSVKDLEHIIEADFLFGSRKQQGQRTGRLFHSDTKKGQHDILMTSDEFDAYRKRLHFFVEKGFKVNIVGSVHKSIGTLTDSVIDEPRLTTHRESMKGYWKKKKEQLPKNYKERKMDEKTAIISESFVKSKLREINKAVVTCTPVQRKLLKALIVIGKSTSGPLSNSLGMGMKEVQVPLKDLLSKQLMRVNKGSYSYNVPRMIAEKLNIFKASRQQINIAVDEIETIIKEWD